MVFYEVDDILIFGVLLSQLVRWSVSRWPYSGANKPPMYGDYEAQRHWMEITVNLPANEWYKNTSQNDLQYWGLDYPPLSAYQSCVFGYVAKLYNPEWVQLNTSRGFESYEHKIFMRTTVIALDIFFFYVPTILYWSLVPNPAKLRDKAIATSLTFLYPGLILIDHGHFQYNCVSLGFTLFAVVCLLRKYDLASAMFFCLALHYKQMSLYHALPLFCYLLGRCMKLAFIAGFVKFVKLSLVVIVTSAICWAPFLQSYETFTDVVSRLFPLDRGLFEDKVANVWCVLSVLIKFKSLFTTATLVKISGISTLLFSLPSSIHLAYTPTFRAFRLTLVNVSMAFFLFSYQVHEKSILLVAIPVVLLIEDHPFACSWFLIISTYRIHLHANAIPRTLDTLLQWAVGGFVVFICFSLVPLLAKDGLVIPYFALTVMFLTGVLRAYEGLDLSWKDQKCRLKTMTFCASLFGSLCLVVAMYKVQQPKRYPHLHVLLNCIYSCVHFVGFAAYFNMLQFKESQPKTYKVKRS